MKKIYHILGADIPHHNDTVLQFFANQLKTLLPERAMAKFWLVGKNVSEKYPQLAIERFSSKKEIAKQIINIAKQDPNIYFYLHGQFNFPVWLAILFNQLPTERIIWHIWGADLYEDSTALRFKLAYPLRRFIQKKLKYVAGTVGDLNTFAKLNPTAQRNLVYFPTKMDLSLQQQNHHKNKMLTILLGNSGDHSNRHKEALQQIKENLGENVHIIVPMGYPECNEQYITQIKSTAERLFPTKDSQNKIEIIEQKMAFNDYLKIVAQCDLGYFIFHRQQGIGTICLLTQLNIPVVLHQKNSFTEDMQLYQIPFLFADNVNQESIKKIRQQLIMLKKENIDFFAPNFIKNWPSVLKKFLEN